MKYFVDREYRGKKEAYRIFQEILSLTPGMTKGCQRTTDIRAEDDGDVDCQDDVDQDAEVNENGARAVKDVHMGSGCIQVLPALLSFCLT